MNADSLRVDVPPSSFDEWTVGWTPGEVVISRAASGSRVPRPQRIILDIRTGAMSLLELYDKPVTRWQIEEVCEGDEPDPAYPRWDHATSHDLYESIWTALRSALMLTTAATDAARDTTPAQETNAHDERHDQDG